MHLETKMMLLLIELMMMMMMMMTMLTSAAKAFEGDWSTAEEELFQFDRSTRQGSERG
jgi:hypothetical protein